MLNIERIRFPFPVSRSTMLFQQIKLRAIQFAFFFEILDHGTIRIRKLLKELQIFRMKCSDSTLKTYHEFGRF